MESAMMKEYIEKKLRTVQYVNIAAKEFPCGVWVKNEQTSGQEIRVVCLFCEYTEPNQIDRIVRYAQEKVEEQNGKPCKALALILSDDMDKIKIMLAGGYPRWFIDSEGRLVIFEGQPSKFDGLEKTLTGRLKAKDRVKSAINSVFPGLRLKKLPRVTVVLVLINLAVQIAVSVQKQLYGGSAVLSIMVLDIGGYMKNPEPWRLLTSVFLHFGWAHLFNNMVVLLYLGSVAEQRVGEKKFLVAYLVSGVAANAVSVWWYVHQGSLDVVTAGASGAVFGIAGLLLGMVLFMRNRYAEITLRQLALMMFFTLYHGFTESGVNNCAHIVGGITGFLCGIALMASVRPGQRLAD